MKQNREHMTTLEDWLLWKSCCTIADCPEDTANRLAEFGRARLLKAKESRNLPDSLVPRGSINTMTTAYWLRVEAFLLAGHTQIKGPCPAKRFKDRLVEAAGSSVSGYEGILSSIIYNDLARRLSYEEGHLFTQKSGLVPEVRQSTGDFGKFEKHPITVISPDGAGQESRDNRFFVDDQLEEPAAAADQAIIDRLASEVLARLTGALTKDERILLALALLDLPVRIALENKLVKVRKSTAAEKQKAILIRIGQVEWPFSLTPREKSVLNRTLFNHLLKWAQGPENVDLARFIPQDNPS